MNNPVNTFDAAQNLEPTSATRNVTLDKNINSSDRAEGEFLCSTNN